MLYIVCEDSNSGLQFWQHIINTYLSEHKHKIKLITSYGAERRFYRAVKELIDSIQPKGEDNYLLLLFDKAAGLNNYITLNALDELLDEVKADKRIKSAYYTRNYSFEELIITALDLDLIRLDGWRGNVIPVIRYCIEQNINWYKIREVRDMLKASGNFEINREKTAYKLLVQCLPKYAEPNKSRIPNCLVGANEKCKRSSLCDRECKDVTLSIINSNITPIRITDILKLVSN